MTVAKTTAVMSRAVARTTWYSRIAMGRARQALKAGLARANVPVAREFLVLDCADGKDASGLFSEAAAVVGCIAEVARRQRLYAGMRVDFAQHGLYHDAAVGPNWWEYFFEPLVIGGAAGGRARGVTDWEHDAFASVVELHMPRAEAAHLVQRHVKPKKIIRDDAERFWQSQLAGSRAIGVHYRGTDKWEGAPVVPFEAVAQAVIDASRSGGGGSWKLFLATDEHACVEFMRTRFAEQMITREMPRSTDGRPLHKVPGAGFRKGADAVIDCLLLSRASHLIRTDSNLGLFATLFNPTQSVHMFGQPT